MGLEHLSRPFCSAAMEHYRSTLSTAAVAVFGLIVAARVLHPGNYEAPSYLARSIPAQTEAATAVAWTTPPAALRVRATASDIDAASLTPRPTIALPQGVTMSPPLPAKMMATASRPQGTSVARRKATQKNVRVRQAALVRAPVTQPEPAAQ